MELKRKWKRFWTLTRHRDGGFTLVELVVVIAILAILAGVAVPAYNGYIEKAKTAADQQLLAAVNKAFAGACMEAGIDSINVTDAHISVVSQMVFGVSDVTPSSDEQFDEIYSTFEILFAENFGTAFVTENVLSLYWDATETSFKLDHVNGVASRIRLSNGYAAITAEDMASIMASSYAGMTPTEVTEMIEHVNSSGELLAGVLGVVNRFGSFKTIMTSKGWMEPDEAQTVLDTLMNPFADGYSDAIDTAANGLQMYAATHIASASDEKIDSLAVYDLGADSTAMGLKLAAAGGGGSDATAALAIQFALAQGFAEAYPDATVTYKEWFQDKTVSVSEYLANASDPVAAINTVKSLDTYKNQYVSDNPESQYQKDLAGFVSTMTVLGNNLDAIGTDEYLDKGINSDGAQTLLDSVLASESGS